MQRWLLPSSSLRLSLNIYRGWVAGSTVRRLRDTICGMTLGVHAGSAEGAGVEIAMVLEEAEPIGGFTGISVSEPLLLVSVVGYMFVLQPWFALLGLAFFLSQTVFVPLLQSAINRRAQASSMTRGEIW